MKAISPVLTPELQPDEIVYAKNQPEYHPLPVLRSPEGIVMSRWQLTEAERQAVASGADILLSVYTFNQPLQPLYIEVCEADRSLLEVVRWLKLHDPATI
jgi:hypothetical protein